MKPKTALKRICKSIDSKKGEDIVVLDVSDLTTFTDFLVICHGQNPKQNQAICDEIRLRLKKDGKLLPNQVEGYPEAEWILMDYIDFIVHIFSRRAREYYQIEKLWRDAVELDSEALIA